MPADNIIYRFDAEGRTTGACSARIRSRGLHATHVIERAVPCKAALYQETDIGWARDGSMFVSDGYGNSRVASTTRTATSSAWGERVRVPATSTRRTVSWLSTTSFMWADRGTGSRIQTFDTEGNLKNVWNLPTAPWAPGLTRGANQVMFVGSVGRVYKMDLSGKILGAVRPSRPHAGTTDSIHALACPDEKTLYLANLYASRFDKWVTE
ncbi:MAG: hypothetical protein U0Q11_26390 [Vicinamibacterales bacterium]